MIRELDRVVLTRDLPDGGLKAGDVGTVVHAYRDGAAYEVEFLALSGETLAVVTRLRRCRAARVRQGDHPYSQPVGPP